MYNLSISQKPNNPQSPSSLNQNNPQYIPNSNINPSMPILQNQNKNSVIKPPPTIVTLTPSQPAKSNTSYNPPSSNYKPTDIQIIKHNPTTGHPQNIPHAISPNLNQQNNFQNPLIIPNPSPSSDNNSQNLPNTSQKELTNGGYILANDSFARQNDNQIQPQTSVIQPDQNKINSASITNITKAQVPTSNQINPQISSPGLTNSNSQSLINPSIPFASPPIKSQQNPQYINRNNGNQSIANSYNPSYSDFAPLSFNSSNLPSQNENNSNSQINNLKSDSLFPIPASNKNISSTSAMNISNPVVPALQTYANKANPMPNSQLQSNRTLQALSNQVNQSSYSSKPMELNTNQQNLYQQSLLSNPSPEDKIPYEHNPTNHDNINKNKYPYSFDNASSNSNFLPDQNQNYPVNDNLIQAQTETKNVIQVNSPIPKKEQDILDSSKINSANIAKPIEDDKLNESDKIFQNLQTNNFNPNLARKTSNDINPQSLQVEGIVNINKINDDAYENKNDIIPKKLEENSQKHISSNVSGNTFSNNKNIVKEEKRNVDNKKISNNIHQKKKEVSEQSILK